MNTNKDQGGFPETLLDMRGRARTGVLGFVKKTRGKSSSSNAARSEKKNHKRLNKAGEAIHNETSQGTLTHGSVGMYGNR